MSKALSGRPPKTRKPWKYKSTAGTVPVGTPLGEDGEPVEPRPVDTWKRPSVKRIRESIASGVHAIFLGEPEAEVWKHNGEPERGPLYRGREGEEVEVVCDTACHCAPCVIVFLRDKFRAVVERHWLRLVGGGA